MEIFSHNYATAYGRAYAVTDEEYLQNSLEPPDRLTTRELNQLRAIREEIESRPRITRFEKRYIRVLKSAEQDPSGVKQHYSLRITQIRDLLKESEKSTAKEKQAITIAFLVSTIARNTTSQSQ
ncbi:MAG: hypothetical protein DKT66_06495 [Candidatus Melainabacteria bacterium]|nr:MAG: hypothetical protein DKT66_06495 [Candidatus Melainabacteria bacterium]